MAHLHIPMKRAEFINLLKKHQKVKTQGPSSIPGNEPGRQTPSETPMKVTEGPPKTAIPAPPKGNFDGSPGGWGAKSAPTLGELTAGPWRR